jgi:hypothetical protein
MKQRMKQKGHLACTGNRAGAHIFCAQINHLKDRGVDGRIIIKCIFKPTDHGVKDWTDLAEDSDKVGLLPMR